MRPKPARPPLWQALPSSAVSLSFLCLFFVFSLSFLCLRRFCFDSPCRQAAQRFLVFARLRPTRRGSISWRHSSKYFHEIELDSNSLPFGVDLSLRFFFPFLPPLRQFSSLRFKQGFPKGGAGGLRSGGVAGRGGVLARRPRRVCRQLGAPNHAEANAGRSDAKRFGFGRSWRSIRTHDGAVANLKDRSV